MVLVAAPLLGTGVVDGLAHQNHLSALIAGTNKKIEWQPIEMVSLPEPGLLNQGVALYKEGKLDDAERCFKKLLHHLPDHAAANFMTGIVYADKGHLEQGCELLEKALAKCPWNRNWRKDLIAMCETAGLDQRAAELKRQQRKRANRAAPLAAQPADGDTSAAQPLATSAATSAALSGTTSLSLQ